MGAWRDNVVRREEFEAAHPDAVIACEGRDWTCTLGEISERSFDLGLLLDKMEQRAGDGAAK